MYIERALFESLLLLCGIGSVRSPKVVAARPIPSSSDKDHKYHKCTEWERKA